MKTLLYAVAAIVFHCMAATAQSPAIGMENGDFTVTGQDFTTEPAEGWGSIFRIYAAGSETEQVLGSYFVQGKKLVFRPRFPNLGNVAYRVVFQPDGAGPLTGAIFDPPPQRAPTTRIEHVYPSADVLPGNVLKLYIAFSAPMSRGEAWLRIHLLDENGQNISLAFLEIEQELWDRENRRLTVLFDPGRIKRGLVPSNELGTPIVEGKRYTLEIDREWLDARGVPLVESYRKAFRGGPVDRDPPKLTGWRITAPRAGTSDPLLVEFGKPMDFALLQRLLLVEGVEGDVAVDRGETQWRFTPHMPWQAGTYQLIADNALEDISGNRPDRAFDVDTTKGPAATPRGTRRITIPFRVK